MIASLIDNDLYKFTMQQAVIKLYPNVKVKYAFTNRNPNQKYTQEAFDLLKFEISQLDLLFLSQNEKDWLNANCSFFTASYLDYLEKFRYNSSNHVSLQLNENSLSVEISGLWHETILYEVPILALISECYFKVIDKDWSLLSQSQNATDKCIKLIKNGCAFSDFGTRRRRSFETHDIIIKTFSEVKAFKYNLRPIGTQAHEWIMAISVLENDIKHANRNAMNAWLSAYPNHFHTMLTDTFGSQFFFDDFKIDLAQQYDGIRHDSGDPFKFVDNAIKHYNSLSIDPASKQIVFSDSLNVEKCIALKDYCVVKNGPRALFGIGTHLTNDFMLTSNSKEKSNPLNIVIKLVECNVSQCVKLSDDPLKHQGSKEEIQNVLLLLNTPLIH